MVEIAIRGEGGEFMTIAVTGRSHPGASDYWDDNWVMASVEVRAGGFRGSVGGHLRAEELADFHRQLTLLQESLRGTAAFATMEDWLSVRVTGDGRGHMTVRCLVRDQPGTGNTLEFELATDQTFTRSTVAELAAVVRAFPVVAARTPDPAA